MPSRQSQSRVAAERTGLNGVSQSHDIDPLKKPIDALKDNIAFFAGFLKQPAQVGSVIPSSRFLEQRILRSANVRNARTVVELGPGTGGTTRAILDAMPADGRLLAIELDRGFYERVSRIDDPRLIVQHGSAANLASYLRDYHLPAPDAIISGIPFSTMPESVAHDVMQAIRASLSPQGRFVAYQVRAHVGMFGRQHLGREEREWEWLNIPPVRVFTWDSPQRT